MLWLGAVLAFLMVIGVWGYKTQQRENEAFATAFDQSVREFSLRIAQNDIKVISPEAEGYRPVRGEIVFAIIPHVKNHDTQADGRLVVTNKAIVFETSTRSERLTYTSLSNVDAKRDGIEFRQRKGPRKAFRIANPTQLGLMVAAFHQG